MVKLSHIMHDLFLVVLCATLIMIISCNPCKRAARICPPMVRDSIVEKTTTVYRDTVIYVKLPRDTVEINDTIYIIDKIAWMPKKCVTSGIITHCAQVVNSRLISEAWISDSAIFVKIDNALKDVVYWKEKYHNEKIVVKEKYIPGFYKFTLWFFIIIVVVVAGYIAIKYLL